MSTPQKREGLPLPPPAPFLYAPIFCLACCISLSLLGSDSDADDVSELALSSLFLKSLFLLALVLEELSLLPNLFKMSSNFWITAVVKAWKLLTRHCSIFGGCYS